MVYDDTRWTQKLVVMGVWDENEARKRVEEIMRRRRVLADAKALLSGATIQGGRGAGIMFDVREEERKKAAARKLVEDEEARRKDMLSRRRARGQAPSEEELDVLLLGGTDYDLSPTTLRDPVYALSALDRDKIRSIRGMARLEYGRIYGALGPFYFDLARARSHADPVLFRIYRDPKLQAKMLNQLRTFSLSDESVGASERRERLDSLMSIFENAALKEFEGGYEAGEVDGRMQRYADVLITLNGGASVIEVFVQKHPVLFEREGLGNPMDAFKCDLPSRVYSFRACR